MADRPSWVHGTHEELLTICPRYRELYGISVEDAARPFKLPKPPGRALAS